MLQAPLTKNSDPVPMVKRTIWIDLENTPHIPFFKPIIRELEALGYHVVLTARDAFQTCELAGASGLKYTQIGRHYGQNPFFKLWGLLVRSLQLVPFILREKPILGLNHGARAQILICNLFRIPTVLVMDYEYAQTPPLVRPTWEIVPAVLSQERLHCRRKDRIRNFTGIKEDVYVPEFRPDPKIESMLDLAGKIVVTVRPPATEAHYHNSEAEVLFAEFMERVTQTPGVKTVLLPRNRSQKEQILRAHPHWFAEGKVVIPEGVINGLNLLWFSDLVVSGGGTMNREAAALGVPVYSIFRGKIGAVDRALQADGRLVLIESVEQVRTNIPLLARDKTTLATTKSSTALADIVRHVDTIYRGYGSGVNGGNA